ncbi:hypothetical protein PoB_002863000, partial [Plakobranchus ocellatus]
KSGISDDRGGSWSYCESRVCVGGDSGDGSGDSGGHIGGSGDVNEGYSGDCIANGGGSGDGGGNGVDGSHDGDGDGKGGGVGGNGGGDDNDDSVGAGCGSGGSKMVIVMVGRLGSAVCTRTKTIDSSVDLASLIVMTSSIANPGR